MENTEKPLIERYRVVIGLLWTQTENLDVTTKAMGRLLEMVPNRGRNRRQLKQELVQLLEAVVQHNATLRQDIQRLGLEAQDES